MSKIDEVMALLERDKGHWQATAEAACVGREWMSKLSQGAIKEPSFFKIERLHKYLSEKYAEEAA
jgi:hypothetical protein